MYLAIKIHEIEECDVNICAANPRSRHTTATTVREALHLDAPTASRHATYATYIPAVEPPSRSLPAVAPSVLGWWLHHSLRQDVQRLRLAADDL